ncbi:hypothetical protein CR513_17520, partial [Mucuna pruriens]
MAQLERPQRQVDTPKTPPTIHTMEQLLRAGEASKSKHSPTYSPSSSSNSSSPSSPFFQRLRHHDPEEDHGQTQKKSVLTKVKEKAKKLRHSLSKRKHEDGNATSPTSAIGDGVEEDAEYVGAPMFEWEKVNAVSKATNLRQNSRGNPVTPDREKHVISSSDKHVVEQDQEKSLNRSLSKRTITIQPATTTSPNATTTITTNINTNTNTNTNTNSNTNTNTNLSGPNPNKTMSETVARKLAPVQVERPDASHSITSKIQGLTVSKPTEHMHDHSSSSAVTPKTTRNNTFSYASPRNPPLKAPSLPSSSTPRAMSAPVTPTPASAPPLGRKSTNPTAQIWDKGVSVKEYLMNKLEPGEDERALSQVISEAMSPRRTPGDAGVMEKVREAVTSLLRTEEPAKYADTTTTDATNTTTRMSPMSSRASTQISASTNASRASSQMPASAKASRASSQLPVSTNAQQDYAVAQEENHGRILQAN